jgi:pimeloyl-ACP methyl ester carboxylesterase
LFVVTYHPGLTSGGAAERHRLPNPCVRCNRSIVGRSVGEASRSYRMHDGRGKLAAVQRQKRTAPSTARPPKLIYTLLEGRSLLDIASLPFLLPLLQATPRGDGHPVLLVPGFAASDATLVGLRVFLRSRGYRVETWGFGQNTGFQRKFTQALEQKLHYMHHRHERKVSLVGWSLGGVYAFYAAHCAPECVRSVVSLGAPMRVTTDTDQLPLAVKALYRYFAHPMGPVAHVANVRARLLRSPPPLPSTCIYSATDGIVPPDAARIDARTGTHENIWVPGSHLGLGFNAAVMWVLADRLAQPEGQWRRFAPDGVIGALYEGAARYLARA